ncbi:MAG TPA: c-type cytochrome [Burkholderiales bacterium]|jgi:cytochrome c
MKGAIVKAMVLVAVAASMLAAGFGFAQSGADVVKAKGCMNCHDVDKKKVGPSFKDIAAKRKGAQAEIIAKLKDGKGHPKAAASDAEIKAAVQHVLSTK